MAILSLYDNDGGRDHHQQSSSSSTSTTTQLGFTTGLIDQLRISKFKMQQWTEYEKSKIDQVAESYRTKLLEEQSSIDALATDLLSIQMERGLNVDNNHNDSSSKVEEENDENIVTKTKELEDEMSSLEVEVSKLEHEYGNREKRISGKCWSPKLHRDRYYIVWSVSA